jgi:hypothetical protein
LVGTRTTAVLGVPTNSSAKNEGVASGRLRILGPRDAELLREEGVPSPEDRTAIRVIEDFVALTARRHQIHDEPVLQG